MIEKIKKKNKKSGILYLVLFVLMFAGLITHSFIRNSGQTNAGENPVELVSKPKPVKLTFSDVMQRMHQIESIDLRGNDAHGILKNGAEFTATIAYDPELLERIARSGATVRIDDTKSWIDYAGTWIWLYAVSA